MNNFFSKRTLFPFIFIFPLLRNADISYLIGFYAMISLHYIVKNTPKIHKYDVLVMMSPLLVLFFSAFYNIPKEIDVSYYQSVFFYPLILIAFIPFDKFEKLMIDKALKIFTISVFILCVVSIGYIIAMYDISYIISSNLNGSNLRILIEQVPYFGNSPIYLSIYILISLVIVIENYCLSNIKVLTICTIFCLTFFILFSKTQIVIFLLYTMYKLYNYIKSKPVKTKLGIFSVFFVVLFFAFKNIPFIYNRIYEMYEFAKVPEGLSTSSSSIRLAILDCTSKIISSNLFLGVGLLNIKNEINSCLGTFNADSFKNAVFFTHNQFLFYFISSGFVGGIAFIAFILYSLYDMIHKNKTIFIICCIIVASMFTEDIFLRQKGITIFATFLFLGYNRVKHV